MEGIPKEFLDIKWNEKVDDSGQFLSEEFLIKHSATYKILNDEFTKVWSSDSDDDVKKDVKEKNNQKVVCKPNAKIEKKQTTYKPFTGYPKESSLSAQQQEVFVALMKKFTNNHSPFLSPQEQQELQIYRVLQEKVTKEQLEYTYFLRDYAFANQSRYLSIKPGIRKYINELWKTKLRIPLKYPQFYESYRTIPLVLTDSTWKIEMHPEDTLLELGRVPRLLGRKHNVQIETEYAAFIKNHPIVSDDDQSETSISQRQPVSQDKNADDLAKLKNAEFVISSSGLKRICDNHGPLFQKSWELPVTVKEYDFQGKGVKKRIIFIDKALPKKKMTVVEKIIWFHKIGTKTALLNNHPSSVIKLKHRIPKEKFKGKMSNRNPIGAELKMKAGDKNDRDSSAKSDEDEIMTRISNKKLLVESDQCEEVVENVIVNNTAEDNNSINSSDLSDSDEDNLVIEDDSSMQHSKDISSPKKVVSQKPKDVSSPLKRDIGSSSEKFLPTTPDNQGKKPVTRSVTKLLENMNKIEKLLGKNEKGAVAKVPVARNLMVEQKKNLRTSDKSQGAPDEGNEVKDEVKDEEVAKSTPRRSNKSGRGKVRKNILDELLEQQKNMLGSNELEEANSDKKYLRKPASSLVDFTPSVPEDSNYSYKTFNLKRKEYYGSSFRILVRCKYDAAEVTKGLRMATIVPKVEFQPEFGAETITVSELTRQWLSLLMKPKSFLVRARVDAFTSKVMMVEQKEIKDLGRDERLHNLQASSCLSTLYSVFRAISDIPPGQYILSHNAKLGAFANLYHAIDTPRDGCYDLHKQYEIDPSVEEPQNIANVWTPIDFGVITPFHDSFNRVPGTFNPGQTSKKKNKSRKKR